MLHITAIFFAALLTGLFFFGGLRYSVDKIMTAKYAWLWALASFFIRMGVAMAVLYVIAGKDTILWLIGLGGMLAGRTVVVRFVEQREVRHAVKS